MKHNITIEQLMELTPKNQIKLKRWALKHHYYWDLSIGQMIEFLDEQHYWDCQPDGQKYGYKDWVCIFKDSCASDWFISDTDGHRYKKQGHIRYHVGELCDALFSAVKEVLEK